MRALIVSDIHGNIDALEAVAAQAFGGAERIDQVWVLGDLVDYGGAPAEAIAWVQSHAAVVVRGNHDHAVGTGEDCRSAPLYHDLAVATREYFRPRLTTADRGYLAALPLHASIRLPRGTRIALVHASHEDPLFGYIPADAPDERWRTALMAAGSAEFVLVGHTHDQFARPIGRTLLVNPGSVGLPKDGDPRAEYAVFDDGRIDLRRVAYDTDRAVHRVAALPLTDDQRQRLTHLIRHARLP